MNKLIRLAILFIASIAILIIGGQLYEYGFAWPGLLLEVFGVAGILFSIISVGIFIYQYLEDDEKNLFNS